MAFVRPSETFDLAGECSKTAVGPTANMCGRPIDRLPFELPQPDPESVWRHGEADHVIQ